MPKKPFREASSGLVDTEPTGIDGIEDKVRQDGPLMKRLMDGMIGKLLHPKPEKDEFAEKLHADKLHKDTADNKFHKELSREGGIFQPFEQPTPTPPGQDPRVLARIAALEAEIGALKHFITRQERPDVSKAALKDEPDQS